MKRRVLIYSGGMDRDCMLILTDAPREVLKEWCRKYNREIEDGENSYFDRLKEEWHVEVLIDSVEVVAAWERAQEIGYDEGYDLSDYV